VSDAEREALSQKLAKVNDRSKHPLPK